MKVLFTTNIPSPYRVDFFNELGKFCDLTVTFERKIADNRNKEWFHNEKVNFNRIYLNGIKFGPESAFCPEVIKIIKKNKFDIIIVGGYSSLTGMYLIRYLKKHKIKFILNCDGGKEKINENKIVANIKKYFIGGASYWLSTGENTNMYLKYYGADEHKIYKYNFTSINEKDILKNVISEKEKNELRNKFGIDKKYVIISVGSFIQRKGMDILIKSAKYINDEAEIIVVGGEPTEDYKKIITDMQIKNVRFMDFASKEKLKQYYMMSDIFVLATREDIWGLVINEAMANGLPIITTDKCIAGLELIENKINGFIVETDNYNEIANKINELINNPILRKKVSLENLKKIKDYTIESMAKQHIEIFNKIIEEKE